VGGSLLFFRLLSGILMAGVSIDPQSFKSRLFKLHSAWKKRRDQPIWGEGTAALCVSSGNADETQAANYKKSSALQIHLFGWEFPDTLIIITETKCLIMSTPKKCALLESASQAVNETDKLKMQLLTRAKEDGNAANYQLIIKTIKSSFGGGKLGYLTRENFSGSIVAGFEAALKEAEIELVDMEKGLSSVLIIKDEAEIDNVKKASVLTNKIMKHVFVEKMEDVVDQGTKVTHNSLAQQVEAAIDDPSKINLKVPKEIVECCYFPIIQSGGKYDLKLSATSNEDIMRADIIIASFGVRFKSYCSNISRTFFIDVPKKVEKVYGVLLKVYEASLEKMIPGAALKDVYTHASELMNKKYSDLVPFFPKSLGYGTGIEFRDNAYQVSAKSTATLRQGATLFMSLGFHEVPLSSEDKQGGAGDVMKLSTFSVQVADTIVITDKGPEILTKFKKEYGDVSYFINEKDEDGDEDDDDEDDEKPEKRSSDNIEILENRTRNKKQHIDSSLQAKRDQKQLELMQRKNEERFKAMDKRKDGGNDSDMEEVEAKELAVYSNPTEYPPDVSGSRMKVDMDKEAVIVPVSGQPVAFHISTIKNVVLPDPDTASYLRLNFYTPGQSLGKDVPEQIAKLISKHADEMVFIKELAYRCVDGGNLNLCYRQIVELRKRSKQREVDAKNTSMLVKQDTLIRMKDQRVPRLMDLTIRPQLSGRKTTGALEAHTNGLRFSSGRGEFLDILYANIKHAIYAPCENETMVVIHFHLKDHIMIGKKRHQDVQFYTEAIEATVNIDNIRKSAYDPDEMIEEQREKELRKKLNHAFKDFCKRIEKVAAANGQKLEFDVPYFELGFQGTPHREMVNITPTVHCLVNVVETPFFVVDLSTIEHIHLERVMFASKNFDMVIIHKDFDRLPSRIDMIDAKNLDKVLDWCTDMEFTYTTGPATLQWKTILQTVKGEGKYFYKDEDENGEPKPAGWAFLRMDGASDDDDEEEE